MGFFTSPFGIVAMAAVPAGVMILLGLGRVQDRHFASGSILVLLGLGVILASYLGALASWRV